MKNENNEIVAIEPEVLPAIAPENNDLEDDLNLVRNRQKQIMDKGYENLDSLVAVARQSDHPRAYEVLSIYLKTLSELNKDLVTIAERRNFVKDEETREAPAQVTNQMFVGSTAELAAMLKGMKSE